ncbi:MAG: hypothetical protein M3Z35_01215 [Nitrospirota bacterium]|nr:hypothetical protein [Nitrospirota bacterium]
MGIREVALLESAITAPQAGFGGQYLQLGLPAAESSEKFLAYGGRSRVLRQVPQRPDGLLHLFEIDAAAEAHAKVEVKSNLFPNGHRPFEVVCDDLDGLFARYPAC